MRQIGGYHFHEYFHGTRCCLQEPESESSSSVVRIFIDRNPIERADFLCFVDTINISDSKDLRNASNISSWASLTTLHISGMYKMNQQQFDGMQRIQSIIQTVLMYDIIVIGNFVGEIVEKNF